MSNQPHSSQPGPAPDVDSRPTSGLAVTSLVLGILFLCLGGAFSLVPLILGIVGIKQTGANGSRKGRGLAIAGVSLGGAGVLIFFIIFFIQTLALGRAKQSADILRSQTHVRAIAQACASYADDHGGLFPPVENWEQALLDGFYIEQEMLISPGEDGDGISYIYLGGENTWDYNQILIYEDPKHWPTRGVVVGFADFHADMIDHARFEMMLSEQQ